MNTHRILLVLFMGLLLGGNSVWGGYKYTIDGYLSDWGVDFGVYPYKWEADGATVDFHITDNYGEYTDYLHGYNQSAYDCEAMYFDDTATDFYIAMVTKYNPDNNNDDRQMGDLWIDLTDDMNIGDTDGEHGVATGLDYAVFIGSDPQGTVVKVDNFASQSSNTIHITDPYDDYYAQGSPWLCTIDPVANPGNVMGTVAEIVIRHDQGIGSSHSYIMEMRIPRALFGADSDAEKIGLHITMWCGNDQSSMFGTITNHYIPIPTPGAFLLVGIGVFITCRYRRQITG